MSQLMIFGLTSFVLCILSKEYISDKLLWHITYEAFHSISQKMTSLRLSHSFTLRFRKNNFCGWLPKVRGKRVQDNLFMYGVVYRKYM